MFLSSTDFFSKNSFRVSNSLDVLSGLIWFQTVCKSYQQTTLGDKELKAKIVNLKNMEMIVSK